MLNDSNALDVVTLQLESHKRYQDNLDVLLVYLEKHQDKHLVMLPEVYLTSFDYEHMHTAAKFSANSIKVLKKVVNEQILVFTAILYDGDEFVNQSVVIHKHKVVHKQNKVKLFKLGDEDLYFRAGKSKKIKIFEIDKVKYGILLCFELRFKELWQQIEGADVVLIPARWGKERKNHLEILSQALAVMNQCYVVVSNSSDSDMASSSAIISPFGKVIMDDSKTEIKAKLDFREIKKIRRYIILD